MIEEPSVGTKWRHKQKGGYYTVVDVGAGSGVLKGERIVAYCGAVLTNRSFYRKLDEWHDKMEPLNA